MFTVEYSTCGGVTISNKNSYVTLEFLLQPIYLPKSGETIYCECLSRVINESGETLNSESFFDNIDDEFIKTVFLLQMEYFSNIKTSKGIFLNLNLSALEDDEFVEKVINKNIYNKFHIEINEISTSIKYSKILKELRNSLSYIVKWILQEFETGLKVYINEDSLYEYFYEKNKLY